MTMSTKNTSFSQAALNERAAKIMARAQAEANEDERPEGDSDVAEGHDDFTGDDDSVDGGHLEAQAEQSNATGEQEVKEDPYEAQWKTRINVLAGKMRAEFGTTSDAETDDSLTPEQRYRLMQADYNAAVADKKRGSYEPAQAQQQQQQEAADSAPMPTNEDLKELTELFGDEEVAKRLSAFVEKQVESRVAERLKPVEQRHAQDAEQQFASKVWDGPLKGIDHADAKWEEFNAQPVPFSGGKTMGQLLQEAHHKRDLSIFNDARAEFDRRYGAGSAQAAQAQQSTQARGFSSIATGGRRSAASVTGDVTKANITAARQELDAAKRRAEKGEGSWQDVRDKQAALATAYGL